MSKELVRFKYKKDIINCVEESWAYYGKEDEQRKVIKELKNVYKIASAAKNDPKSEYEAKAEAFDRIVEERNRIGKLMHNKEYPQVFTDEAFWNIDDIIIYTERGGSDD